MDRPRIHHYHIREVEVDEVLDLRVVVAVVGCLIDTITDVELGLRRSDR